MNNPNAGLKSSNSSETASWYTQIGRLKRKYPILTNADLNYIEGEKSLLVEALCAKLGVPEIELLEVMVRPGRFN